MEEVKNRDTKSIRTKRKSGKTTCEVVRFNEKASERVKISRQK